MIFELIKIVLGSGKREKVCKIFYDAEISDFCFAKNLGFVFISKNQHGLHLLKDDVFKRNWVGSYDLCGERNGTKPLFSYPSSLCYSDFYNKIFIVEDGGASIRTIETSPVYCNSLFAGSVSKKIKLQYVNFKERKNLKTFCDVDEQGQVYWGTTELNKIFMYSGKLSDFKVFMGTGRSGFSIASDIRHSLISRPNAILCCKKSVYVSDSGNFCVRDRNKVVAGQPRSMGYEDGDKNNSMLTHPSKIAHVKNVVVFTDGNRIRYFHPKEGRVETLGEFDNIVSICVQNNDLFALIKEVRLENEN